MIEISLDEHTYKIPIPNKGEIFIDGLALIGSLALNSGSEDEATIIKEASAAVQESSWSEPKELAGELSASHWAGITVHLLGELERLGKLPGSQQDSQKPMALRRGVG